MLNEQEIRAPHCTTRTHRLRTIRSRILASSNLKKRAWRASTRELSHIVDTRFSLYSPAAK